MKLAGHATRCAPASVTPNVRTVGGTPGSVREHTKCPAEDLKHATMRTGLCDAKHADDGCDAQVCPRERVRRPHRVIQLQLLEHCNPKDRSNELIELCYGHLFKWKIPAKCSPAPAAGHRSTRTASAYVLVASKQSPLETRGSGNDPLCWSKKCRLYGLSQTTMQVAAAFKARHVLPRDAPKAMRAPRSWVRGASGGGGGRSQLRPASPSSTSTLVSEPISC